MQVGKATGQPVDVGENAGILSGCSGTAVASSEIQSLHLAHR